MSDDAQLRWALRQAALRNAQNRRIEGMKMQDGLYLPSTGKGIPSPEHYHLIYNVPKDNLSIPYFGEVFITSKEAYDRMKVLGDQAEPNTEWYEDGQVGIETRLHGRADLWWIILEAAACIRSACLKNVSREQQKRQLVLIPGDGD